jgi:hypothetical protein
MLLEDARILPERRRLVFPIVDLPDDHLERVLCRRGTRTQRERRDQTDRASQIYDPVHAHPPIMLVKSTVRPLPGRVQ